VPSPEPFFRYYGAPGSYFDILKAGLTGGLYRDERTISALESRISRFIGSGPVLALPQARLGLYLALRQILTPEKPKVILSPYTIYDVVNMVICAGGTPVFADIEESTCNIDFAVTAGLVDDQTGAVIVTHLHGLACDIENFASLCRKKEIPLIEDCAQAFGAMVNGKRLGSIGAMGVFSFSIKKHVNSLYGGCLGLLRRAFESVVGEIAGSAPVYGALTFPLLRRRVLRGTESALAAVAHEHNPVRRNQIPKGYLCRMSSCQARVAARQIPDVDRQIGIRIGYAREYHGLLGDLTGIQLPPLREDGSHAYLSFAVQVSDRLQFQREMMSSGCDVRLQAFINNASSPCYADLGGNCPNAERTASRVVLLPIHTGAGTATIRRIAAAIRAILR
jgi:dTDP-4-amino-4,6-dideoxygalactose transaminase